jgi:protein disulfide-isomerase
MLPRLSSTAIIVGLAALQALSFASCKRPSADTPPLAAAEQKTTSTEAAGEKLHWEENLAKAVQQAQDTGKLVLLNFTGTSWCPPCLAMEKETFSTPEFAEYARRKLVLAKVEFPDPVDFPEDALKLATQYLGDDLKLPTYVLLDGKGKNLGQTGYQPGPEAFMAQLEKIALTAGVSPAAAAQ